MEEIPEAPAPEETDAREFVTEEIYLEEARPEKTDGPARAAEGAVEALVVLAALENSLTSHLRGELLEEARCVLRLATLRLRRAPPLRWPPLPDLGALPTATAKLRAVADWLCEPETVQEAGRTTTEGEGAWTALCVGTVLAAVAGVLAHYSADWWKSLLLAIRRQEPAPPSSFWKDLGEWLRQLSSDSPSARGELEALVKDLAAWGSDPGQVVLRQLEAWLLQSAVSEARAAVQALALRLAAWVCRAAAAASSEVAAEARDLLQRFEAWLSGHVAAEASELRGELEALLRELEALEPF